MYNETKLAAVQHEKLQAMHCGLQESAHSLISWLALIPFPIGKAQCDCPECNTSEAAHVHFLKQILIPIAQEVETINVKNFDVTLRHNFTFFASRIFSVVS